jgi:hypothetical protein
MGLYLNFPNIPKETWLMHNATPIGYTPTSYKNDDGELVAVWVNNGAFTAVALAYCQEELEVFTNPNDTRQKAYFWIRPEHKELFK